MWLSDESLQIHQLCAWIWFSAVICASDNTSLQCTVGNEAVSCSNVLMASESSRRRSGRKCSRNRKLKRELIEFLLLCTAESPVCLCWV